MARWAITTPELHPEHRTRVAKQALWFATECDGKLTPRFRTRAAMAYDGPRYWSVLQHEHVVPLRVLVDRMVANPDQVEEIVRQAPACLVTKEEHQRLTPLDRTHEGWDRYRQAGIDVVDALTGGLLLQASPRAEAPSAPVLPVRQTPIVTSPPTAAVRPLARGGPTYLEFWPLLRARMDSEHRDWRPGTPQGNSQHCTGPVPKTRFQFDFATQGLRHQLLLSSTSREENAARLMDLVAVKDELQEAYGAELRFEQLPGRTQCRVADYLPGASIDERARWDEYVEWFLSSGARLRTALASVGLR
jgi:hypothetical protein